MIAIIRIAVVDDDEIIARKISRLIDEILEAPKSVTAFYSGIDFFNGSDKFDYDLVLLDIDMPDINGFQLAENLKTVKPDITIIFVSNMEHLVFKSIEFKPFRFIRKESIDTDLAPALISYQKEFESSRDQCIIQTVDYDINVPVGDIIYFESMGHDIYVKTLSSYIKLRRGTENSKNMKEISTQFERKGFVRVHRSFLVNCKYIFVINRTDIILKNSDKININPHNVNEIKSTYLKYLLTE